MRGAAVRAARCAAAAARRKQFITRIPPPPQPTASEIEAAKEEIVSQAVDKIMDAVGGELLANEVRRRCGNCVCSTALHLQHSDTNLASLSSTRQLLSCTPEPG